MTDALISPRQREILTLIKKDGAQFIEHLADRFDLTTQTIRRDINTLCDLGYARRFHGGVDLPVEGRNISANARFELNSGPKRQIAERIAAEIEEGSTVFLGIGTTVQFVAQALKNHRDISIVTNNLDVALALCDSKQLEVHLTGGTLRHDDRDVVGLEVIRFFEKFHATYCVVGAGGLSATNGLLDFSYDEAMITNAIIENAQTRFLAADVSKWTRAAAVKVAPFDKFDKFFTDRLPPDSTIAERLAASGVETVFCAGE